MYRATQRLSYNHRQLGAGDEFDVVDPLHGRLFVAHRMAVESVPPPAVEDMAVLRAEYQRRFGKRARLTWDATAIRERLLSKDA